MPFKTSLNILVQAVSPCHHSNFVFLRPPRPIILHKLCLSHYNKLFLANFTDIYIILLHNFTVAKGVLQDMSANGNLSAVQTGQRQSERAKKSSSIKVQFTVRAAMTIILLFGCFIILFFMNRHKRTLIKLQTEQERLMLAATEIQQTSQDLTRLSRLFVLTGSKQYEDKYYNTLRWRNGEIVRPTNSSVHLYKGKQISQRDLLAAFNCKPEELDILNKAFAVSNELARVEKQAMESFKAKTYVSGVREIRADESAEDFAVRILQTTTFLHSAICSPHPALN